MDFYDLRPGTAIDDRFEIVSLAGRGGAGVVFRALDRMTGAPVALKVLPPASTEDGADRMQREARVLAALRHPRIVSYIAHGCLPQDRNFLVMEWLEGEDLRQLLHGRRLSFEQSLAIVRGVAEGLAAVHRRGIVHRDIKPSNLFVRDSRIDRVMLIDFGVARSQSTGWTLTQVGQIVGTLCYMAPEQVRGERTLGPAVDIFALGCVFYECLTGHPLFGGQHPGDALARFSTEDPLQFFHTWSGGPAPELTDLLRRMLAKDPSARLRDGDALLEALEALGSGTLAEIEQAPVTPALFASGQEQHLLTFILAVPHRLIKDPEATNSERRKDPRWPEVEALMKLHRTRLDLLANGIFVVSPTRTRLTPADQAVYMTRLVLMLKECLPRWGLAVTTLRGAVAGLQPVGKALWMGADILRTAWRESANLDSLSSVWTDGLTAQLLDTHFHVRRVKPDAYVLEAERSSPDQQRLLLGRPTPCVGRDNELFLLEAILTSAREDPGARAVLVLAPPGQGKSRLRHEFVRRLKASERPVEVLFGRADPVRAGVPHALLTRALLGLCGLLEPAEGQVGRLEPFVDRIGRHVAVPDRPRVVEFLGELCGLHFPDAERPSLQTARQEPRLMSEQLEGAWLDFLRAECAVHPVLLVLEDLHWSDMHTVRLVDIALRELADHPLMVLALARPDVKEVFPQLWEERTVQELRLGGLPRRACPQLIRETLGERATPELVERIVRQAGGNALFLEELIRAAAEGKDEALPETVLAMIEARLWRLDPEARRILRVASLFGESFWRRGVMELLGDDRRGDEFDRWLKILVSEELIVPHGTSRYPNDKEFGFRHALLRDAALNIFNADERVMGHRLAAEYLERQGETDPLVLAEHYECGGLPDRAASLYAQAAAQALARSDLEGSLRYVERGLACGASNEALGLLQTTEAWARFWRFDLQGAFRASRAALQVLSEGSSQHYRALGAATLAAWNLGEMVAFDETLRLLGRGDPPSESPEARHAFLEMACMISSQLAIQGKRQEMASLLAQMESVMAAESPTSEDRQVRDLRDRGQLQIARISWHIYLGGDPWALYCDAQSGVALFAEAGDRRMQWIVGIALGAASLRLGDYEAGAAQLYQAIANLERLREALGMGLGSSHLALGLLELGDPARLAEARQQAEALRNQIGVSYFGGLAHAVLARVLAQEGAWAAAHEEIGQALANSHPTFALQPLMFATLTEILLGQGKLQEAVVAAREGLARVEQLGGTCWYDIRMYLAAGEAYGQAGLHEEAQQVLRTAGELLRQRAERIPDDAVRARYLTRVPYNARVFELLGSS